MKSKKRLHHLTKSAGTATHAAELTAQETHPMSPESRALLKELAASAGVSPQLALEVIAESVLAQAAEDESAIETLLFLITNPSPVHA